MTENNASDGCSHVVNPVVGDPLLRKGEQNATASEDDAEMMMMLSSRLTPPMEAAAAAAPGDNDVEADARREVGAKLIGDGCKNDDNNAMHSPANGGRDGGCDGDGGDDEECHNNDNYKSNSNNNDNSGMNSGNSCESNHKINTDSNNNSSDGDGSGGGGGAGSLLPTGAQLNGGSESSATTTQAQVDAIQAMCESHPEAFKLWLTQRASPDLIAPSRRNGSGNASSPANRESVSSELFQQWLAISPTKVRASGMIMNDTLCIKRVRVTRTKQLICSYLLIIRTHVLG